MKITMQKTVKNSSHLHTNSIIGILYIYSIVFTRTPTFVDIVLANNQPILISIIVSHTDVLCRHETSESHNFLIQSHI